MFKLRHSILPALVLAAASLPAFAQQPPAEATVIASEPGKAAIVRTVEISARVVAIDKTTRTVTLKGPKGNTVDVIAGDEVRNFDQIKVGNLVVARYIDSLFLELKKTKAGIREGAEQQAVARAEPGQLPAAAVGRQVVILADVVAVDPKKSTITLRGPKGNVVTLPVQNPDQFKVVKKGDQVEATYTQAVALSVEPAPETKK